MSSPAWVKGGLAGLVDGGGEPGGSEAAVGARGELGAGLGRWRASSRGRHAAATPASFARVTSRAVTGGDEQERRGG